MNEKYGPLMSDEEFYNSLRSDIPEIDHCVKLFMDGKSDDADAAFFDYIISNLDRKKYFNAISFAPEICPDDLTLKQAEEALEYNMVSCDIYHKFDGKIDWYSNHTYNNYEEWTWQLSRHRQVLDLAWVYYYNKDEKYAKCAIDILYSWIRQAITPPIDTDGHDTLCWRTIECGIRMSVWAKVIILLLDSPFLTAAFVKDFFKSVFEHAQRLSSRYTAANWLTIEMKGLYLTSLLYPFFKQSVAWRKLARDIFVDQMNKQTLDDGTHYELSFGYQLVSLIGFSDALRLGRVFGDEFPTEYSEKMRLQFHAIVKAMLPNGDTPNVNDGKLLDVKNSIKPFVDLFWGDDLLNFAVSGDKQSIFAPNFTSVHFQNAGFVLFRDGWSENSIAGFFDGGKFGKCHNHEDVIRCHQHEDKLNFLMYIGKKNVICEAESYAYDTSKMRYHVLSSAGHNTALVNGKGQSRLCNNHWDDSMLHSVENVVFKDFGDVESASALYNEGYGEDAKLDATHERHIYFVKKPMKGSPYFIVKDILSSKDEKSFDIVWHYNTNKLDILDNKASCDELTTFFAGESGDSKQYFGSSEPFAGWKANSFTQGDFAPIPTLYYNVKAKTAEVIFAFVPNIDGECFVESVEYLDGVITVKYKNGEKLTIDY